MKRFFFFLVAVFFLSASMVRSQENASRYLDAFARKYSSLKDYTADVRVHFDLEALKAPDMQAKLYYKSPDKIKAESKGVFFLPRQGGYFNPALLMPDAFEIKLLDHMTWDGRKAVKLQLIPKDMQRYNQRFVLIIDTERGLILEMDTVTIEGREIKATIDYGKFGAYDLPTHIALQLEVPPAESNESKELIPFVQKGKRVSGKIDIIYSNYAVNSGLSDEIFIRTEPYQLN